MDHLHVLFERIGIETGVLTSSEALFIEAFTHRSAVSSAKDKNNERLEFLGDAVLELITTEFLFKNFDLAEGDLTNYRSALVKRENLAKVARKLDLGSLLYLSKGEERSGGREKDYLLANVVESLIGALYLTVDMEVVRNFIENYVLVELDEILEEGSYIDSKTRLQEITQGELGVTPTYKVLAERGKDHEKEFDMEVLLGDKRVGTGHGRSKKEAQVNAAAKALESQKKWSQNI